MGGGWTELKEASYLQPDRSRVAHAPWVLCAAHPSLRSPGRKLLPQVDGCPDLACFLPTGSKAGSPVLPQGPLTPAGPWPAAPMSHSALYPHPMVSSPEVCVCPVAGPRRCPGNGREGEPVGRAGRAEPRLQRA